MKHPLSKGRLITYIAISVGLIIVGALVKIPFALPLTLQLPVFLLTTFILGEYAVISAIIYLVLGLVGLPIFAFGGGLGYVFQPSFGYIIGFVIACFVCGKLFNPLPTGNRITIKKAFFVTLLFLAIVYFVGVIYFVFVSKLYLNSTSSIWTLLTVSLVGTIWKDLLLSLVFLPLGVKLLPLIGLKK
ncbi:MAG: biotin transporter BioY [Clostridia bacterium]|nr:biotin transporter BioY [Clostridia bacterium]